MVAVYFHDALLITSHRRLAAAEDDGNDTVEGRIHDIVIR